MVIVLFYRGIFFNEKETFTSTVFHRFESTASPTITICNPRPFSSEALKGDVETAIALLRSRIRSYLFVTEYNVSTTLASYIFLAYNPYLMGGTNSYLKANGEQLELLYQELLKKFNSTEDLLDALLVR